MIALLLLLAAQQQAPKLSADMSVDRDRISVGEEVILTIRARGTARVPIQINLPPIGGLELEARSERSEVAAPPSLVRTTILEWRLRGSTPGKWRIGPARVRQGSATVEADPIEVEVVGQPGVTASSPAPTTNPRVERMLARASPPSTGEKASVSILLSSAAVYPGEQVDVVTAAWFPRELRLQLRRPPTLQVPSIDGVWSYPQRAPGGIAASRLVGGRWFDLFIVHQVVYPLAPGRITIPPATLHYSVPLAFQFFSQEERYSVQSDARVLNVKSLPARGRPAGFAGPVARALTVERRVSPASGRVGEPLTVDIVLRGEGNVALWPPPPLDWPAHFRAYPDHTEEQIAMVEGRLTGTKTFRYMVIPDSARAGGLPVLDYAYFDPEAERYGVAEAEPLTIAVAPGFENAVSRVTPPDLILRTRPGLVWRLVHGVPPWLAIVLAGAPWLLLLVPRLQRRRGRERPAPRSPDGEIALVEEELGLALAAHVPDLASLEGNELESALRAAGVEPTVARQAVSVRDRIRRLRYGPVPDGEAAPIVKSARELIARFEAGRVASLSRLSFLFLAAALLGAGRLGAQAPPPEQLYQQGALRAAQLGFEARVRSNPAVAASWYNLGATYFRQGDAGAALAAWARAQRLDPRNPEIRRALRLVPAHDSRSARALWVAPVTPEELLLLAAVLWIVGWSGRFLTRGRQSRWFVPVGGAILVVIGFGALSWWYGRPLAIVTDDESLALSPHELAPVIGPAPEGTVVYPVRGGGDWTLVRDASGRLGWLPARTVMPVAE
ncbi:MAG: hypothetical protein AB7I33_03550 [Gemmatimonadales bacterium]